MTRKMFTFVLALVFSVTLTVTTLVSVQADEGGCDVKCSHCPGYPSIGDGAFDEQGICHPHVCIPPGGCPPPP